jgi:putative oxidoreductase
MANSPCGATALIGRILISQVFILAGINKFAQFSMMAGYMAAKHVPAPDFFLACAAVVEILGGLAVLFGAQTKLAAWLLFVYMIPITLLFHNFWAMQGMERIDNQIHFMKNLAIMGGLLLLASFGAGGCSVDSKCAPRPA